MKLSHARQQRTWLAGTTWLLVLMSCGHPKEDRKTSYAHDLLFLGANNIILSRWDGPVFVSKDLGKSWKEFPLEIPLKELASGSERRVWGIHGSKGIHGPSTGYICRSDDGGETWSTVVLEGKDPFIPQSFASSDGPEPVILASDGQLWQHVTGPKETRASWTKLGDPNPEHEGNSAAILKNAHYVASSSKLWMSVDGAKSWTSRPLRRGLLGRSHDRCWVIERLGYEGQQPVLRTMAGSLDLELVGTFSAFGAGPFRFSVDKERILAVGETGEARAAAWVMDADGKCREIKGVQGKQCYSVRLDQDGRAWFAADGLYRETAGQCEKIWP